MDHRGTVVGRRVERRVPDDERVDRDDGQHGRGARGHMTQGARAGRAVQEDAVPVTGEEHRHHPGPPVDDGAERAREHVVEDGVEGGALGGATLLVAVQAEVGHATILTGNWTFSQIQYQPDRQDRYRRPMPRVARAVSLPLRLDRSDRPLRHRIADALVTELREGRLRPGDPLPSTRALATELAISRGPVVAAYDELTAAGFIETRPGSGAVVAPLADRAARAGALSSVEPMDPCPTPGPRVTPREARFDLRPGRPDVGVLDQAAWRRAWRVAASDTPANDSGPAPSHTRLRHVLADHIRRSRGIAVDPDDLLVTPGVSATLQALPAALGLIGRPVAVEDPGYVEAWTAFSDSGSRVRAVPVDDDGLDPQRLRRTDAAVYVTPSHQYPLGARMPVVRRTALLDWARRDGGLVIEDDYDGEFR